MALEGSNLLDVVDIRGGDGTGRLDRGERIAECDTIVVKDPVSGGEISTHKIYGPATPNVGSAYALPRNHALWAPMDFEVRAIAEETAEEKEARQKRFEPKSSKELSLEDIAQIQIRNREYFKKKKPKAENKRLEFIPENTFNTEKKGYFFGMTRPGDRTSLGFHLDYVQMRTMMNLDVGDRCEARYGPMTRYFNGIITFVHDDDCSYDIRFEHGHTEHRIPCEQVHKKQWIGKIKEKEGLARSLLAANPLLETKDAAVEWYERLLLYERGDLEEEPLAPDSVFSPDTTTLTPVPTSPNNQLHSIDLEAAARASPESDIYKKVWDSEGRPHRFGPPLHLDWYGRDLPSGKDGDLCGDSSLIKKLQKEAPTTAKKPIAGDLVECHFICRHYDNAIIHSTYDHKTPMKYLLFTDETVRGVPRAQRYVQGLHEALASMSLAETATFAISPEKAYGRKGYYPTVPGFTKEKPRGSWLFFEIELLRIHQREKTQENGDQADFIHQGSKLIIREAAYSLLSRPATGYEWEEEKKKEVSCDYCGKPKRAMHNGRKFQICTKCKEARYCSRDCASRAWQSYHREQCAPAEDNQVIKTLFEHKLLEQHHDTSVAVKSRNEAVAAALVPRIKSYKPRVALIVAYRNQLPLQDRQAQLFKFVPYMVAFLGYAEPRCDFVVIVATQTDDGRKFNRGRLMNAAFRDVVQKDERYDSVIFHDVDILPSEELMPLYAVPPDPKRPLHLAGAWRSKYRKKDFFGGAIAIKPQDFIDANGYPNDCWGWGLDDAEFGLRMRAARLRVLRPPEELGGYYVDLDPINLHNIVFSEERGYYHEYWNMDMENGKCKPKIYGPIDWENKFGKPEYWKKFGLADIDAHSNLVARTEEFNGRVIRLLYALENTREQKESINALISGREGLKSALDNPALTGPVAANALAQTNELAKQGNLAHKANQHRISTSNIKLLSPEDRFRLQGGKAPLALLPESDSYGPLLPSDSVAGASLSSTHPINTLSHTHAPSSSSSTLKSSASGTQNSGSLIQQAKQPRRQLATLTKKTPASSSSGG